MNRNHTGRSNTWTAMRMTTIRTATTLILLLFGSSAYAQTGGFPSSYVIQPYQGTTATKVGSPLTLTLSSFACDQPAVTQPTSVINPTKLGVDEVQRPGRKCIADVSTIVAALPDGTYTLGLTAVNGTGPSGETRTVPFVRARPIPPPDAPTGVVVLP